jgi:iron(III) transport system permease protein
MTSNVASSSRSALWRRWQELRLIGQDSILAMGLLVVGIFVFLFVALPLFRVVVQGFVDPETGEISFEYFTHYVDPYYRQYSWQVVINTMKMGLGTATCGTILGFIFAYTMVRCSVPFARFFHIFTLLPTISPPFAIAIATILLFGRSGLITKQVFGMRFTQGMNDIYGLDGLIFVQTITFFPVAYLIIRSMLEHIDASMEEAALSLGASKFHIFHTVTMPLLVPGLAGSFLLLFVESLADLGNPLLLGGNTTVLSTEIFLAINGQYDQQKAAALSLILLIPTLTIFVLQRYYVSRRSYVAVTGKPTTGRIMVKEPLIRWTFITITFLVLVLIMVLYLSIFLGSFTRLWGIDYSLDFSHYQAALGRGLNAILSTTFLSAVATPIAGLVGMIIAFMVVRRNFAGKQTLDFVSNLGGAVPGTILGIGYIVAFIGSPSLAVTLVYLALAGFLVTKVVEQRWKQIVLMVTGFVLGYGINWLPYLLGLTENGWRYLLAAGFLALAALAWFVTEPGKRKPVIITLVAMAGMLVIYNLTPLLLVPMARSGRAITNPTLSKIVLRLVSFIGVFTRPTMTILGFTYLAISVFIVLQIRSKVRAFFATVLMAFCASLTFFGTPLALVGTPYIIIAAYSVRSLPASVRAGVAALQQIDPSIEEASNSLGADSQYTFRYVTLPLILPAFIAGLIFAFARHMTSLSAVIFLTTPEWPILTVWILSEVEQGGMSTAAAYSMILIFIVLIAIGLMYWWLGRQFGGSENVDLSVGAG